MNKLLINALIIALIASTISCKKNAEKMIQIQVVEYKTNTPIQSATVNLTKLGSFDLNCVCFPDNTFLTKQTDASGSCQVSEADFNSAQRGINVSKDNYWPFNSFPSTQTRYELDFIGQINLHLIKINSYPDKAFISINCSGERTKSGSSTGPPFILVPDTTFTSNAFGGQTNTISWKVYAPTGTPTLDSGFIKIDVAKTATATAEIMY